MDCWLLHTATVLKSALHLPTSPQYCTATTKIEVDNPFADFEQYTKVSKWFADFHKPLSQISILGRSRQWHWSWQTICRLPDTFCTVNMNSIRKILKQNFQTSNLNSTSKTSEFELVINMKVVDLWKKFPINFKSPRTEVTSIRYKFFNQPC